MIWQKAVAFCVAREIGGYIGGSPPMHVFFGTSRSEVAFHLTCVKEMNNNEQLKIEGFVRTTLICKDFCSFFGSPQKTNQKKALRGSAPKYPGDLAR